MDREGPDIVNSMDVGACKELIAGSKIIKEERGGTKEPVPEEQPTIDFAFATVVTIKPIKKGEIFSKENLWVKRPGTGDIPAEEYQQILGKVSAKDIEADVHLTRSFIQ
jgi:N-acetylneuraminate synthase